MAKKNEKWKTIRRRNKKQTKCTDMTTNIWKFLLMLLCMWHSVVFIRVLTMRKATEHIYLSAFIFVARERSSWKFSLLLKCFFFFVGFRAFPSSMCIFFFFFLAHFNFIWFLFYSGGSLYSLLLFLRFLFLLRAVFMFSFSIIITSSIQFDWWSLLNIHESFFCFRWQCVTFNTLTAKKEKGM